MLVKLQYIKKKKKDKSLYLEERRIPIINMAKETETATEIERKQMMVERWVYLYNNPTRSSQSNKTEQKLKRINQLQSFDWLLIGSVIELNRSGHFWVSSFSEFRSSITEPIGKIETMEPNL